LNAVEILSAFTKGVQKTKNELGANERAIISYKRL
jgi:hypothetical protein